MTKPDPAFRSPNSALWRLLFAAVVVFVYLFGLTIPLVGPDEPRYAQVAREMFERGDWVTPTLGGFNWFEKPSLLYWLEIVAYRIFGVSEFAARLGSALFGLGTVASLWILGRNFTAAMRRRGKKEFADWVAVIAASTVGLIVFSRAASFDIILTFPMTASLVGFFVFESSGREASRLRSATSLFAFYFFIGASLLAKGLIGAVFPAAIVSLYYLLSWKRPSRTFIISVPWGAVVAAAVAATWYVPMYLRHGYAFIDEFFVQHHFQRYTSNKYLHPQPFYFFFWVLPLMTIPWLPFFVAGVWRFVKERLKRRDAETQRGGEQLIHEDVANHETAGSGRIPIFRSPLLTFAFAWMLVPLVFFSFSGSKLPGYILPAVPAAIIFAAAYVWHFVGDNRNRRMLVRGIAGATFLMVTALLIFAVPQFAEGDSVKSLIVAANKPGFADSKVLSLHTVSHNAEFYAAGRIVRDADGKQRKFLGPTEIQEQIRREIGRPVLVLVPIEYLKQLTDYTNLRSDVIKDNGELAIVAVSEK